MEYQSTVHKQPDEEKEGYLSMVAHLNIKFRMPVKTYSRYMYNKIGKLATRSASQGSSH